MPAPWVALIVVLWVVVIMLAVLVLGLLRRIQHLQPSPLPAAAPRPPLTGPTLGRPAPVVAGYKDLAPSAMDDSPQVVVFLNSSCGICVKIADELRSISAYVDAPTYFEGVELVIVTDPVWAESLADLAPLIVGQIDGKLSERWQVPGTPYAVAIDHDGYVRAASFVTDLAHLREIAGTLHPVSMA
jgi:hypothetical protein